ncbi:MAG TPA: outer membrane lipoprotein carrier protein LolA [Kofleriaceae bacterium]|nr:outer membrane lipoprotein carrier protein LolA [Kofleriaceae bacterium]
MIRGLGLVAWLVPAIAIAQPSTKPPDAAKVLAAVEATYKKPTDLTASFEQTVVDAAFGRTTTSKGQLYVQKPNKLRFDYANAKGSLDKAVIFDGKTLWVVEPSKLQVLKHTPSSSALPSAITFFTGAGSLAKDFKVALSSDPKYQAPGGLTLALVPKQPSAAYKELYLLVDPATNTVDRTIVIDSSGNTNTFVFGKPDTKGAIKPATFVFDPKKFPNYAVKTP